MSIRVMNVYDGDEAFVRRHRLTATSDKHRHDIIKRIAELAQYAASCASGARCDIDQAAVRMQCVGWVGAMVAPATREEDETAAKQERIIVMLDGEKTEVFLTFFNPFGEPVKFHLPKEQDLFDAYLVLEENIEC